MSNYLEELRSAALATISNEPKSGFNSEDEWAPSEVATRVRFLPLPKVEGKLNYPYRTHSYHYIEGGREDGKDTKLFVRPKVTKDGVQVDDPIDSFVKKLYDTKNDAEKKIAGKIKRKRSFYFNVLVYEEGKDPQLKTLIDTSSDGKLARRVCSVMGIPFCKDIDQKWFPDKDWKFDGDKAYYDLINEDEGFDFKIKKSVTGKDPWNFDYNESFAITKGPRPLSKEEKAIAKNAKDLDNYVNYTEDFNEVDAYLRRFIAAQSGSVAPQKQYNAPKAAVAQAEAEDDISDEDLRSQLIDEDEDE